MQARETTTFRGFQKGLARFLPVSRPISLASNLEKSNNVAPGTSAMPVAALDGQGNGDGDAPADADSDGVGYVFF